jgi:hypothetical protein
MNTTLVPVIVERDDGKFQIGTEDNAPGPFETRLFAQSVIVAGRRAGKTPMSQELLDWLSSQERDQH